MQIKDELDDFKKLELCSSFNSSVGRSNKVMDVDKDIEIKNSPQNKSLEKKSSINDSNHVNQNAGKFKGIKGSYHNFFK
jgi:hypothetical protein